MAQHKISESNASKFAMDWALQRLGHRLDYYTSADTMLKEFLPKYNEAMDAIHRYNQSVDSSAN